MNQPINETALAQLFTEARSHHAWSERSVPQEMLSKIYDLMKFAPTAVNANPARFLFITSEEEKTKLLPALMGSNVDQVKAAPVTVVVATDEKFYEELPRLFPFFDAKGMFENNQEMAESTGFRNSSLQGAYFILAARAMGLDVCPMSGFNQDLLDESFFKGSSWKSNFILTLGYGDHSKVHPRGERLSFEEACSII